MYKGYLDSYYRNYPEAYNLDYDKHYSLLLNDSTEFVASYVNHFNKLGIDASCIIANDPFLQNKWRVSKGIKGHVKQEILFRQIESFKPDVLWIDDFHRVEKGLLPRVRSELKNIKLIMGYHCSPYDMATISKMRFTDFLLTCTLGMKMELESIGLRSYHVYHGFDTDILLRLTDTKSIPQNRFVFSGTLLQGRGSHNRRIKLIENILEADIGLSIYLNLESPLKIKAKQTIYSLNRLLTLLKLNFIKRQIPVFEYINSPVKKYPTMITDMNRKPFFGIEMYKLLCSSGVVLNIHGESTSIYCGNMRMFEATGAGCCLLTENKINLKELFEPGVEVVSYDNTDNCIEKAKWLLENDNARKEIAKAGQQRTLSSHSVRDRCMQIIQIIEKELGSK